VEHAVFFTGADGAAQYRRTADLEDAVRVVEHLRNVEGVEDARVFSMTEVPLQFKAVYRVELAGAPVPAEAPAEPAPVEAPVETPAEPVAEAEPQPEPEPEPVMVPAEPFAAEVYTPEGTEPAGNGRNGRGLGFFTR